MCPFYTLFSADVLFSMVDVLCPCCECVPKVKVRAMHSRPVHYKPVRGWVHTSGRKVTSRTQKTVELLQWEQMHCHVLEVLSSDVYRISEYRRC